MIIVKLMGGLGNQMFQYALGRHLAEKNNTELKLDLFFLKDRTPQKSYVFRNYDLDIFRIKDNFATEEEVKKFISLKNNWLDYLKKSIAKRFMAKYVIYEPHFHFCDRVLSAPDNSYLEGYWQSEKYFIGSIDTIKKDFTFKDEIPASSKSLKKEILKKNSVCIHVRRNDYVSLASANRLHGFCERDYFYRAVDYIKKNTADPHLFIYSDDPAWCEENLKFDTPFQVVGNEHAGEKAKYHLHLMSLCKHFIISNSSFSWWAVWLNRSPEKIVVAPGRWFRNRNMDTRDLVKEEWILM